MLLILLRTNVWLGGETDTHFANVELGTLNSLIDDYELKLDVGLKSGRICERLFD